MDSLYASLLGIGSLCIIIIIATMIITIMYRDVIFIRFSMPYVTLLVDISFIISIATSMLNAGGSTNCILYHYDGFLNVILIASSYIAMMWNLVAILVKGRRMALESIMDDNEFSEMPRNRCSFIENLILKIKDSESPACAMKIFFFCFGTFLILPILENILDPVYHDLNGQCESRTSEEVAVLVTLFVIILVIFVYGLAKIWKFRSAYGQRQRLVGMIISWVIILLLFLGVSTIDTPWMQTTYKILSVVVLMVPWAVFRAGPMFRLFKMVRGGSSASTMSRSSTVSESDEAESQSSKTTLESVLFFDSKKDSIYNFALQKDAYVIRDTEVKGHVVSRQRYTYAILFLRAFHGRVLQTDDSMLDFRHFSIISLLFDRYVKVDALYPAFIPEGDAERRLSEAVLSYRSDFEAEKADEMKVMGVTCYNIMKEIYVSTINALKEDFFREYKKSDLINDYIEDLRVLIPKVLSKSGSTDSYSA